MNRIATSHYQSILPGRIADLQGRLADDQRQMASGKRAADYAALGPLATRSLSAHGWQARTAAQRDVADRLATRLSLNELHIGSIDEAGSKLKKALLDTLGTGNSDGLQTAIEQAYDRTVAALNASDADGHLFAGARRDVPPLAAASWAALAATPPAQAFVNDTIVASAEVEDGVTMRHGLLARDIGEGLYEAFRTLAAAGPIGNRPTATQRSAIESAIGQMDDGLSRLRAQRSDNGQRQAEIDAVRTRHGQRDMLARQMIGKVEDADLGEVATRIANHQSLLEASYALFAKLKDLTLTRFL